MYVKENALPLVFISADRNISKAHSQLIVIGARRMVFSQFPREQWPLQFNLLLYCQTGKCDTISFTLTRNGLKLNLKFQIKTHRSWVLLYFK